MIRVVKYDNELTKFIELEVGDTFIELMADYEDEPIVYMKIGPLTVNNVLTVDTINAVRINDGRTVSFHEDSDVVKKSCVLTIDR